MLHVRFVTNKNDWLIPYQIHAVIPWIDPHIEKETTYLVGFPTQAARDLYAIRHHWEVMT